MDWHLGDEEGTACGALLAHINTSMRSSVRITCQACRAAIGDFRPTKVVCIDSEDIAHKASAMAYAGILQGQDTFTRIGTGNNVSCKASGLVTEGVVSCLACLGRVGE